MMLRLIIPILFTVILSSCASNSSKTVDKVNYEDSVLHSKDFIDYFISLPLECSNILKSKIKNFYTKNKTDSISNIYSISGNLYPEHYSEMESDMIEKFSFFIYRPDTIENLHFGVNKRTADIIFLNDLKINDQTRILTKEEHVVLATDLKELEKLECVKLNKKEQSFYDEDTYLSLATFEHNEKYLWVVDSIQEVKGMKSIFSEIDTFRVENNKYLISKHKKIPFFFENFEMYFVESIDTIPGRFISYAENYRILLEVHDESYPWVYLRRLK